MTAPCQGWIATDDASWIPIGPSTYGDAWDALLLIESKGKNSARIVLPTGGLPERARKLRQRLARWTTRTSSDVTRRDS